MMSGVPVDDREVVLKKWMQSPPLQGGADSPLSTSSFPMELLIGTPGSSGAQSDFIYSSYVIQCRILCSYMHGEWKPFNEATLIIS